MQEPITESHYEAALRSAAPSRCGGTAAVAEPARAMPDVAVMVALCDECAGMYGEELLRETLAVFGGRRLTPGITARLQTAVDKAVATGRLHRQRSGLLTKP